MQKFSSIPSNCHIESGKIDIWQFTLQDNYELDLLVLNEDERQRAERFHFNKHKNRFASAHASLRKIISKYTAIAPKDLEFSTNKYGKPLLKNYTQLQFNLSHSRNLALLAIGHEEHLGIDLEFFSARPFYGIGKNLFSEIELKAFSRVSNNLIPLSFFSIWAQKEAFIKACGMGLSYPTKEFSIPIMPHKGQDVFDPKHNKNWHISTFMPKIGCSAAICHSPSIESIRLINLPEQINL